MPTTLHLDSLQAGETVTVDVTSKNTDKRNPFVRFKVIVTGDQPLVDLTQVLSGQANGAPLPLIGCKLPTDKVVHGVIHTGARIVVRVQGERGPVNYVLDGTVKDWSRK